MKRVKLEMAGREPDGSPVLELTGLPGGAKEIPGLVPRRPHQVIARSTSGSKLAPEDLRAGYSITVRTQQAAVVIRITKVRPDDAVIGTVERLDAEPSVRDVGGVTYGDIVIVHDRNCIHLVGTELRH